MEEPGGLQSMGSLSRTWLSNFTFTFHSHALEKETATHSSVLAWRIPGTGEPGGLSSMGARRVGHDWCDLAAAAANQIQKFIKRIIYYNQVRLIPGMQGWLRIQKLTTVTVHKHNKVENRSSQLMQGKCLTNSTFLHNTPLHPCLLEHSPVLTAQQGL